MIARQSIEEVLSRVSIEDVVAQSVQLKRAGSSMMGLCPFHNEKTPSFHVRAHTGRFHCFGCGASGNVIGFVMKVRGLSFPEAVEALAQQYSIALRYEGTNKQSGDLSLSTQKAALYKLNALAHDFFVQQLARAPQPVKDYVVSRGLTPELVAGWGIGYAPQGWRELSTVLIRAGVSEDLLSSCGLIKRNERGEWYDIFRGRLIFPVYIDRGRIVAFGGRSIPALLSPEERDSTPKYINSPETIIYKKQETLYGLEQAMHEIRASKKLTVVEGYLDVISMHAVGVRTAVATCGTALTPKHVKRVSSLARSVEVLFDGDTAGRAAAGKSFEVFLNSGLHAQAVFLPPEHDPDSLAKQYGDQTGAVLAGMKRHSLLRAFVDARVTAEGAARIDQLPPASKGRVAKAAAEIIARVENSVEAHALRQELTELLEVPAESIASLPVSAPRVAPPPSAGEAADDEDVAGARAIRPIEELPRFEVQLLEAAMAQREAIPAEIVADAEISPRLSYDTLSFCQQLAAIAAASPETQKAQVVALLNERGGSWKKVWRRAHGMREKGVDFSQLLVDVRRYLRKEGLFEEMDRISQALEAESSEEAKLALMQQRIEIKRTLAGI